MHREIRHGGSVLTKRQEALLGNVPSSAGLASRLAYARARAARVAVDPLLRAAGLSLSQIEAHDVRLNARHQIKFLDLVAEALNDDLLGFHVARDLELREVGLFHYVMASATLLGDALKRGERYCRIANEAITLNCELHKDLTIRFNYVGVSRHSDRHQIELWMVAGMRLCRTLTNRELVPAAVTMIHRRNKSSTALDAFFGRRVKFEAEADTLILPATIQNLPVVSADPYLHQALIAYFEDALADRPKSPVTLRHRIENTIAPLLPHGNLRANEVAKSLGMSHRTLARRLAADGVTFATVVDNLRYDLAKRYLREADLSISRIAWLLGYHETSAFTHAFKRWTGAAPTHFRIQH
jgi:AraC-like DNA-binding protein